MQTIEQKQNTPGPWVPTNDGEANFYGIATTNRWLFRIQQNGELSANEQIANQKLISASPDMLEFLIAQYKGWANLAAQRQLSPTEREQWEELSALIQKAIV